MRDAALKKRIRQLVRDDLAPLSFSLISPRLVERQLAGLRQGIEFQPGTGALNGQFTLNIFWRFLHPVAEPSQMHACLRIGDLLGADLWFYRDPPKLEEFFPAARRLILEVAMPYLDAWSSIQRILEGLDSGALSRRAALGPDAGWQAFNLGWCYFSVGQRERAAANLTEVLASYSDEPMDWVVKRKQAAEDLLRRLQESPEPGGGSADSNL